MPNVDLATSVASSFLVTRGVVHTFPSCRDDPRRRRWTRLGSGGEVAANFKFNNNGNHIVVCGRKDKNKSPLRHEGPGSSPRPPDESTTSPTTTLCQEHHDGCPLHKHNPSHHTHVSTNPSINTTSPNLYIVVPLHNGTVYQLHQPLNSSTTTQRYPLPAISNAPKGDCSWCH